MDGHEINLPDIRVLELSNIDLNDSYQRPKCDQMVTAIAGNFDPFECGTLHVAIASNGENCYTIDGQHRLLAMRSIGIKKWPCVVKEFSTKQQALAFVNLNRNRRNVTAYDRYRAMVVAEDPVALSVSNIARRFGLKPSSQTKIGVDGVITSVSTMVHICRQHGERMLSYVIGTLISSFGRDPAAFKVPMLGAVWMFIARYASAENPVCAEIRKKLSQSLRGELPSRLIGLARLEAQTNGSTSTRRLFMRITQKYNSKFSGRLSYRAQTIRGVLSGSNRTADPFSKIKKSGGSYLEGNRVEDLEHGMRGKV